MKHRRITIAIVVALFAGLLVATLLLVRAPLLRRARFPEAAPQREAVKPGPAIVALPRDAWTDHVIDLQNAGAWEQLDDELEAIAQRNPAEYRRLKLGYLHGRVELEAGVPRTAYARLGAFLRPGDPFRDLALHYRAVAADAESNHEAAAAAREALIFDHPESPYRAEEIETRLAQLDEAGDPEAMARFVARLRPSVSSELRRALDARIVALRAAAGDLDVAIDGGKKLLAESTADDAADLVLRALDRKEVLAKLAPDDVLRLGDAASKHRHYERAVALLSLARPHLPKKRDEIDFAIGRAHFGNENYAEAERVYTSAANPTKDMRAKATFLFHASRCAQLQGDDARAERLMTAAIAVPGRFTATSAALTQRMRTRIAGRRYAEAASDLVQIRRLFSKDTAQFDAGIAYAIGMIAAKRWRDAGAALDAIPKGAVDKYGAAEIEYWRGRIAESTAPADAVSRYLRVLRASVPTHFAYLARQRLATPGMQSAVAAARSARSKAVAKLLADEKFEAARAIQTDVVLLSPRNREELDRLRQIYERLPVYQKVLHLEPEPFPRLSDRELSRTELLLAMGLFDDAADGVEHMWNVRPAREGLTRSYALNRGGASKQSIYAVEVMMRAVPDDYVPELLPRLVRQLLYPRYYYAAIQEDAEKYHADPLLVVSIMREESRFNPRAKSLAAARGLLQFIMRTALDIGRSIGIVELDPEDLYDPRVIIQLGAKYLGELSANFDGDPYAVAASYNAGPNQTKLWKRMAPAPGADFFLSSVNFEETKHYVRKVLNSYLRYEELYGGGVPAGGTRAEP